MVSGGSPAPRRWEPSYSLLMVTTTSNRPPGLQRAVRVGKWQPSSLPISLGPVARGLASSLSSVTCDVCPLWVSATSWMKGREETRSHPFFLTSSGPPSSPGEAGITVATAQGHPGRKGQRSEVGSSRCPTLQQTAEPSHEHLHSSPQARPTQESSPRLLPH